MTSKKLLIALFAGICFFLSSVQKITAQSSDSVNAFYFQAIHNAALVYHQAFGDQKGLYNGSQYIEYPYKFKEGDPYFNMPYPEPGSVLYDGVAYDSVLMRYNEITDELVINYYIERIQLLKPKIEKFHFFNSDFIKIEKDSLSRNLISNGFYNLLYRGKISLLKKEIKTIVESSSINVELLSYVEEKDYYYIKKDGRYYSIKRKNDFFDLLSDKRRELKEFVKVNDLNFRRDRQKMLTQATAYYDSLKK
ncbi:hypothetical protein BH11BAC5_BH11BAC5_01130 [soil metagenome]